MKIARMMQIIQMMRIIIYANNKNNLKNKCNNNYSNDDKKKNQKNINDAKNDVINDESNWTHERDNT